MMDLVRTERHGTVGLIEIDHPPVNALAQPVRAALLQAVESLDDDPGIVCIVIFGVGKHFIAGADIREFNQEPRAPLLNDLLLRIESCRKPVVAAMHGTTLGGGAELALASHYRAAAQDLSLGFPEIKLGLLPGSGGTVRLPRIVGTRSALELMTSGEPISFKRASALGFVDYGLQDATKSVALAYGRMLGETGARPRPVRERAAPSPADLAICDEFRDRIKRSARQVAAGTRIVDAMEATLRSPFEAALREARQLFEIARTSVESRALRHLFLAERAGPEGRGPGVTQVEHLGVVGAGTMGAGIATSALTAGLQVTLVDASAEVLEAAKSKIRATLDSSVRKGRMTRDIAEVALSRLVTAASMDALQAAHVVIEAVFENLPIKQEVFRSLAQCTPSGTLLATNTSTLDIDAIAGVSGRPTEVVGMHFFSPAHVMRLVEIARGERTSDATLATVSVLARRLGKIAVEVGNAFGFVGNRMLYEYGREKELLLLEGASPEQVDGALEGFGMAMGPNAVSDLSGIDIGCQARRVWAERPADPRYYRVSDLLVERGRLGQKSGRGFYRYVAGGGRVADPEVDEIIREEARRLGVERRKIEDSEIVERCMLALINAGACLLDRGIARRPADIDVIWCNGYGFPRARGGPMFHADVMGLRHVRQRIAALRTRYGEVLWPRSTFLEQLTV